MSTSVSSASRSRQLRRNGHLIGSAPGEDGGYYLISTPAEFQTFLQNEFLALISDMSETVTLMRKSADTLFGSGSMQSNLFHRSILLLFSPSNLFLIWRGMKGAHLFALSSFC